MTAPTNARLLDRIRRRIPESWRLWVYNRIKDNMAARRLVHGMLLVNAREERFIDATLLAPRSDRWTGFDSGESTVGFTERVVEIPWVLSRLRGAARVLDIGTSFALPVYVSALVRMRIAELVGVDIAPVKLPGVTMLTADVRKMPFADGHFDAAVCISTLEHIGRDGTPSAVNDGDLEALRELRRVLSPSGRLFVTVPFGRSEYHPWFRQYDIEGWTAITRDAGFSALEQDYYLYAGDAGWKHAADPAELMVASYQADGATAAVGLLCACLQPAVAPVKKVEAERQAERV
jgi:SAM-dependent methyltransferase